MKKSADLLPGARHDDRGIIRVHVTTRARAESVREEILADGAIVYRVRVTTVPEDGKANETVIKVLAKTLGVAKSRLSILRGHRSRNKTIKIE